jgi:hypothetical protein
MEFSIGIIPKEVSSFATLSKTAGIVQYGISSSPISLAASCVNVPLGPRNEIKVMLRPP